MTTPPKARGYWNRQRRSSKPQMLLALVALLLALTMAPSSFAASPTDGVAAYVQLPTPYVTALHRRQAGIPSAPPTSTAQPTDATNTTGTVSPMPTIAINITTTIPITTTSTPTVTVPTLSTIGTLTTNMTTTLLPTITTNSTASPTETSDGGSSQGLVIGGAAVGGLVVAIGVAIVAFRCTLNRRDRQRRNKEMAATLAESFDRSGDPISTPRKGYMELGDGPSTPSSGRGANLSRQGSQDAYFGAHKEGSAAGGGPQDYYNPHYVQERYGAANTGNYGMYEETELSVIGGSAGRSMSPYPQGNNDHSMAYPPSSIPTNHYAGYDYGQNDGGYYGGGGQAPRGHQGY